MIAVTFNGNPAWLIDDLPDWQTAPELTIQQPLAAEQGLSGIETRRQTGDTLRMSLKFTALLSGGVAVTNLRNSLQGITTQPVLCPLWPALFEPGVTPPITAPYYVAIGDGLAPTIEAAAALPLTRPACPLMIGRLTAWPSPDLLVDNLASVDYTFLENDDSCMTPPAFVPATTLSAANGARPVLPWRPDWNTNPKSGSAESDIEYRAVGMTRTQPSAYYTQDARRKASFDFTLFLGSDAFNLISFFNSIGVENFWLPGGISDAALTVNVLSTDSTLTVDNPAGRGSNVYLLLDDLSNRVPVTVIGTSGSQWILSGAVGTAFGLSTCRLESLILARFDTDKITMRFFEPGYCTVSIPFVEVPWEATAATTETIGTTFGPLPTTAILIVFEIAYPGGAQSYYFTNFERDLSDGVNTYKHTWFEHDPINETDTIERQSVALKTRNFIGNPVSLLIPFALEFPLQISIYEADVNDNASTVATLSTLDSAGRCLFYGEVTTAKTDGPFLDATCESLPYIFDRQVPRRLLQLPCSWNLFESLCTGPGTVSAANWTWTGTFATWDGVSQLTITGATSSNLAALPAHFFAAGYVTLGTGSSFQIRLITDSTAATVIGSDITFTLSSPLLAAPASGATITFYPGCDKQYATCTNKFNNALNFGGFPFTPAVNPTLMQVSSINSGKK
jgi:hypothetical protein